LEGLHLQELRRDGAIARSEGELRSRLREEDP
jgi:hypothetical protein